MKDRYGNGKIWKALNITWLVVIAFASYLLFCAMLIEDHDMHDDPLRELMLSIGVGIPILLLIIYRFSEISIGGISIKKDVANIEKALLSNQVVASSSQYYWIDENQIMQKIPDRDTALFLSRGQGIKAFDIDKFKNGSDLPSWGDTAKPISLNDIDLFLLYNDTIYYQSGHAWIYKLAALNGIKVSGELKFWEDRPGHKWVENISISEFKTKKVVN